MIKRYKFISTILIFFIILLSFMVSGWEWENGNHLLADGGGQNYHGHCTIMLQNGSILCMHYDYPAHNYGGNISSHVSHDNGATWVEGTMMWDGTSEIHGAVNCGLGLAPNGSVVVFVQVREYGIDGAYYGMMFKQSFDNGVTWTSAQYVTPSDKNATRHISSQVVTKGNTMYAPLYNDTSTRMFSIYVSTNNGSSWTKRSEVYDAGSTSYSYPTLAPLSDDENNGGFIWYCHYDPSRNYYRISTDNCTTWGTMTAMDIINIRDCDINVMFEDNGSAHFFLHGRDLDVSTGTFGFWYSTDALNWQDQTNVDQGSTKMAYSSGCAVGDDMLLTYSKDGDMCNLRYTWIYNVTNSSDALIQFIDINGGGNSTVLITTTPTFNWTNVSVIVGEHFSGTRYRLEIANDSAFTDVVVNFSNVSSTNAFFSGYYSDNSTRISLELHPNFELDVDTVYYCRVTPYYIATQGR